ncbi:hypothetical protein [uncultured Desulfosarcina sp.]|uniref:hypothetical protein n=1 Tax=uncultured Desulfosarcina sp. TaxID=218289 RepID=UPI0029C8426D|nr:hypothetical protein [uncultured Desulfosarcina sp.]
MKTIKRDLLKRLHPGIVALIQYIETAPPGKPLVWFVDRKTPVSTLPDFRYARQAADELKEILERDAREESASDGTGQEEMREAIVNNVMFAVCVSKDRTVTLTVFEDGNSAAVNLDAGLLRLLIQTMEEHSQ